MCYQLVVRIAALRVGIRVYKTRRDLIHQFWTYPLGCDRIGLKRFCINPIRESPPKDMDRGGFTPSVETRE